MSLVRPFSEGAINQLTVGTFVKELITGIIAILMMFIIIYAGGSMMQVTLSAILP